MLRASELLKDEQNRGQLLKERITGDILLLGETTLERVSVLELELAILEQRLDHAMVAKLFIRVIVHFAHCCDEVPTLGEEAMNFGQTLSGHVTLHEYTGSGNDVVVLLLLLFGVLTVPKVGQHRPLVDLLLFERLEELGAGIECVQLFIAIRDEFCTDQSRTCAHIKDATALR